MEILLKQNIRQIRTDDAIQMGSAQIFALYWDIACAPLYITLDEAFARNTLEVTEIHDQGQVSEIKLVNKGMDRIFLMAGEELLGAKQNRVLNTSLMVEANTSIHVPVSCVEKNRWQYRKRTFTSEKSSAHSRLRAGMSRDVTSSYQKKKRPFANQGKVWHEVDRKMRKMESDSHSAALHQVYQDYQPYIEKQVRSIRLSEDCCGIAVAINGKIIGMDLFDKPETFANLRQKILNSYMIDALEGFEKSARVKRTAINKWLKAVSHEKFESYASPGLGRDIRVVSGSTTGAALEINNCPIHVGLFFNGDQTGFDPDVHKHSVDTNKVKEQKLVHIIPTAPELLKMSQRVVSAFQNAGSHPELRFDICRRLVFEPEEYGDVVLSPLEEQELVKSAYQYCPSGRLRILVTRKGLSDNWFIHYHAHYSVGISSLYQWHRLTHLPAEAQIASTIILHSLRALNTDFNLTQLLHQQARGCLFDFCKNKPDIALKLTSGRLCTVCESALRDMGFSIPSIQRMLDVARQFAVR